MQLFAAAALLGALAYALPSAEERAKYQALDDQATAYGFDYEAYTVKCEDDYELALFRIIGDPETATDAGQAANPLLFMHGGGLDAAFWLQLFSYKEPSDVPMMVQMANLGYDVWMGNNRGTRYSNVNAKYPNADDLEHPDYETEYAAKYDWDMRDQGMLDGPAFIDKMLEVSGKDKAIYMGYSKGTAQHIHALTQMEETYFADKVEKSILMTPCIAMADMGVKEHKEIFDTLDELGIKLLSGPNWKEYHYPRICNKSQSLCDKVAALGDFQATSPRSWHILTANGHLKEFADYMPTFDEAIPDPYPLVEPGLDSLNQVPLHLFVIAGDTECPAIGARKLRDMAPSVVQYTEVFPGGDHVEFSWSSPKSLIDQFEEAIASDLTAPGEWYSKPVACSQNDSAMYLSSLGGLSALALAATAALLN